MLRLDRKNPVLFNHKTITIDGRPDNGVYAMFNFVGDDGGSHNAALTLVEVAIIVFSVIWSEMYNYGLHGAYKPMKFFLEVIERAMHLFNHRKASIVSTEAMMHAIQQTCDGNDLEDSCGYKRYFGADNVGSKD